MAEEKKDEYYLTEPTSRKAQEDMLERMTGPVSPVGGAVSSDPNEVNAPYAVEDNDTSGYVGVSQEYMTYANDTEKPLTTEEGVEADLLDLQQSGLAVKKVEPPEPGEQSVGTGSLVESVYSATSGENFTSEVVDPKKVEGAPENPKTPAQPVTPQPTPVPDSGATSGTSGGATSGGSSTGSGTTSSNQ
jgi:hypothetical protein